MKKPVSIPADVRIRGLNQLAKLPVGLIITALKQLTPFQWKEILDGSAETQQSVMNRLAHAQGAKDALIDCMMDQVEIKEVK